MHLRTILRSVAVRVRVVSQLSKLELVTVVTHKYIVLQEQAEKERVFDGYPDGQYTECVTTNCGLPIGNLRMLAFIVAVTPALARPLPQVPGMRAAAPVPVYYDHDHEVCAHKAHSTRTPRATHRKAHGSQSNRFHTTELPGPEVDASDGAQCVVGPAGDQTAAAAV